MAKKWQPREFIIALQKRINITNVNTPSIADNQKAVEFKYKGSMFTLVLIRVSYDNYYGYYELFAGNYKSNLQGGYFHSIAAHKQLTMDNVLKSIRSYSNYAHGIR